MKKMKLETSDLSGLYTKRVGGVLPEVVTEIRGKDGEIKKVIDFEKLKTLLTEADEIAEPDDEKYEFTWVGKKEAMVEANKPIRKTLRPCKEESKDWDNTENLYIEGDNLEVLKLLQESYLNKIKMIYIDPPYNTGNDFIYNDDFKMDSDEYKDEIGEVDEEGNRLFKNTDTNGRFHSDWCSMMYSRLMLARNLLSEDGVIFISIDDNEQDNMKKICDEVLGEKNFRNILQVRRYDKNINQQFINKGLNSLNIGLEYIFVYTKNSNSKLFPVFRAASEKRANKGYWKGFWNNADRPTMRYELCGVMPTEGQWKWKKEVALEAQNNYDIFLEKYSEKMSLEEYWEKTGKSKKFIKRNPNGNGKNCGVEHWIAPNKEILRTSNWSDMLVSSPVGFDLLFSSPKNPNVIKLLLTLAGAKTSDIILDFFSGSATTAHAVMDLNAEDGGNRKFIMVQLPEECDEKSEAFKAGYKNICEIGKERIRRAGDKIKEENADKEGVENLDTGFRVLKVDDTNMKDVYYTPDEYSQRNLFDLESNIKEDRTELDLLYGCLIEWGIPLNKSYESTDIDGSMVHIYNDGDLIACFDEDITEEAIKKIAKMEPLRAVFRDSSFKTSAEKINVEEIFKLLSPETSVRVL